MVISFVGWSLTFLDGSAPIRQLRPVPADVPPAGGEAVPAIDVHAAGRTSQKLAFWAEPLAADTGISVAALEAYGNAELIAAESWPECHLRWNTLAGIGFVETRHGTYSGNQGLDGQLRYDPMSMRPFMSYPEGDYLEHWLRVLSRASKPPIFAHVNWFQREPETGRFLWPGYRDNLRALLWLIDLQHGRAVGRKTPAGIVPLPEELNLTGMDISAPDLAQLLTVDAARWLTEMEHREEHLAQFAGLPEEITAVHERIRDAFQAEAG